MRKKLQYYQSDELLAHFNQTDIFNLDFEDFLEKCNPKETDFVFLDPPYDSEFNTYAQNDFSRKDQRRLAGYMINKCRAKIHSDIFLNSGILRIEKHDDRLCLRNPGTLLLPVEEIYEGGHSKSRNPRMQKMFRLIGYGENIGSGFPKILHAWKQVGWKEPMLEN